MKTMICFLLAFQLNFCLAEEQCAATQLNTELEQMFERDQGLRLAHELAWLDQKYAPSPEHKTRQEIAWQDLRTADQQNYAALQRIVSACGWPDARQLSYKANSALFFVAQHGSKDDRIKYFPYFEKQYQENQLHSARYAMMVDRMRFDRGLPQLYGTQFFSGKEGVELYGDVEEPEKLNQRREQMGLSRILVFDEKYATQLSKDSAPGKRKQN